MKLNTPPIPDFKSTKNVIVGTTPVGRAMRMVAAALALAGCSLPDDKSAVTDPIDPVVRLRADAAPLPPKPLAPKQGPLERVIVAQAPGHTDCPVPQEPGYTVGLDGEITWDCHTVNEAVTQAVAKVTEKPDPDAAVVVDRRTNDANMKPVGITGEYYDFGAGAAQKKAH